MQEEGTYVLDRNYSDYYGFEYKDDGKAQETDFKIYKKVKEGLLPLSLDSSLGAYRFTSETLNAFFKIDVEKKVKGKGEFDLSQGKYLINIEDSKLIKMRQDNKIAKVKLRVSRKVK